LGGVGVGRGVPAHAQEIVVEAPIGITPTMAPKNAKTESFRKSIAADE